MLLTRKAPSSAAPQARLARGLAGVLAKTMDRRAFLRRSGVTLGAGAVATQLPFNLIGEAQAQAKSAGKVEVKRTICTHCSVGCAIDAVVENGVWVRQEPVFDAREDHRPASRSPMSGQTAPLRHGHLRMADQVTQQD